MTETLISAALRRIGKNPLKRLEWAVDFSQRSIYTPEKRSRAELELTCFFWAPALRDYPGHPVTKQIRALMTEHLWIKDSFQGQEVERAQRIFAKVLETAADDGEFELPLEHVKVQFTRNGGLEYVPWIPDRSSGKRTEAKLEAITFKLLRLLDKSVRTSNAKAKGGERFTPMRLYVGICPEDRDGCGRLFAKTRIDQEYCCRACVSRAQVHRFRRNQRAVKQLYPVKRMKQLSASERSHVEKLAESLRLDHVAST